MTHPDMRMSPSAISGTTYSTNTPPPSVGSRSQGQRVSVQMASPFEDIHCGHAPLTAVLNAMRESVIYTPPGPSDSRPVNPSCST